MNWSAVGAIAEGLGAIAVVVSLVYLASQVRQSNAQAQGAAHADWLTTWNETIKGWVRDRDTVVILQRGFEDLQSLSNVEQAIFAQQVAASINHWHLAADLSERKLLDQALYEGVTDLVVSVCATAGGRDFLESNSAAFPRGAQLLQLANSGRSKLPPFNVLAPWWSVESNEVGGAQREGESGGAS
jgi:hypothetical protein